MKYQQKFNHQADLYKVLAHPARLAILEIVRNEEHCVCHFEAILRKHQAYISQQLRVLRDAGLIECRRVGLNRFYRLTDKSIFKIIDGVSEFVDYAVEESGRMSPAHCVCPKCFDEEPALS